MPKISRAERYTLELAEFLAAGPTPEQILAFHPSKAVQRRASALLRKQDEGPVSYEEQQELDELVHVERLVRLLKALVRSKNKGQS